MHRVIFHFVAVLNHRIRRIDSFDRVTDFQSSCPLCIIRMPLNHSNYATGRRISLRTFVPFTAVSVCTGVCVEKEDEVSVSRLFLAPNDKQPKRAL